MNKIEEVKQLRNEWQVRELRAEDKDNKKLAAEAHNIAYGLTLAIGIFKKLSNIQMQTDTKPCHYCATFADGGVLSNFCPNCGKAFYD